jgi:hypothetical protein
MRRFILAAVLLTAGLLAVGPQAEAAWLRVAGKEAGAKLGPSGKGGWACGPLRCVWSPNGPGRVPPNAPDLGEPLYPGCYWRRGVMTHWRMICP